MKKILLQPAHQLRGVITVPGDKSISHRAVMLGSLAYGKTQINHFLDSADCRSTIGIFKNLGVRIKESGDRVTILGHGLNSLKPSHKVLDAGNSGTTARLLLGILAGQPFTSRLTGDKYLRRRPMRRVVEPLTRMGARITGKIIEAKQAKGGEETCLPMKIETRKLKGITYELPVASAQVKSALLMAGLFAEGTTTVKEPIPTRDHTERMFSAFSIPYTRRGNTLSVKGPMRPFHGRRINVPGDFSSASFFIVAGLIVPGSQLTVKNVGLNPTRTGLLQVLENMGARIKIARRKTRKSEEPLGDITVESSPLQALEVAGDIVPRMIDEFPVFAVAATQARGTTIVKNAKDLRVKESDRITMMAVTLKRMGADIETMEDGWIIQGPTPLKGCTVHSGGDHRIAMALAVAALVAKGPTTILDTKNIDTSFPNFESLLHKVSVPWEK